MISTTTPSWEALRTEESRAVEESLRATGFAQVDAYRYNSASIRVRVIDPRFEGRSFAERDGEVEPHLATLPESIQADIVNLLTFAPTELDPEHRSLRDQLMNLEFEDPGRSML